MAVVKTEGKTDDPYLNSLLGDNEDILLSTRQHWFVFVRSILLESIVLVAIFALVTFAQLMYGTLYPWIGLLFWLMIIPFISLVLDFFSWWNRKYIITDFRVIQISGIINKDVIDSSLEKVNDVKLTQSFLGRIFNFGTVEILTASERGVNRIRLLGDPISFKTTMVNAKESLESGAYNRRRGVPKDMGIPTNDIPSLIAQLDNLRQQGVISQEEFQAKKADLLRRM
jgi:uncharacterized membrane protein YdbT with pleckstrin-like domain